jgi:hypothetical protein
MHHSSLKQKHRSAKSIIANENRQRQKQAEILAELVYDIFKEKKARENDKIVMDQNNAKFNND